jgi:CubicO group peptidase (beta-lactamase class C family)
MNKICPQPHSEQTIGKNRITISMRKNDPGFLRYLIALIGFFFIIHTRLTAQLQQVAPETQGMSSARLANIDSLFKKFTGNRNEVAGVTAIVLRHGKIVYYQAAGYGDISKNKSLKRDDLFRIASQTKAITVAAVMMLYEEGKLLLDDPISKYIPEFSHPTVLKSFNEKDSSYETEPSKSEITIRQLLTHTSGISYTVIGTKEAKAIYAKAGVPVGFETRHILLADKMKILAKLPLMHQPGKQFTYGLSTDVLGYLIEIVSGMSLNNFFRQRIFDPLEMKDTYFYIPPAKQSRLSKTYITNEKGVTVENNVTDTSGGANSFYPTVKNGSYYSGGAGLSSTAYDYALFLQMLANGGTLNGKRLLSPSSIRLMTMNQLGDLELPWAPANKLGFVFQVVTERGSAEFPWNAGTYIGGGYWGSLYWVDPKAGIVAQIWTQHFSPYGGELFDKFKAIVYGAITE